MENTKEIIRKYEQKLESQINTETVITQNNISEEYIQFKKDMIPELSSYERWAKSLGNILSLKIVDKDRIRIQKYLDDAHLDVTASQSVTLAFSGMLLFIFVTGLLTLSIFFITDKAPLLFAFLGLIASMFVFYYAYSMPQRLANAWRLKASSEMVPAILYIVVYMKHTSNLERAIEFASEHLEGPLALDFKKVFYDVEIGKYSTIKQSLDNYLEQWRDYSPEFIESFHLIESSLFEPNEARRVEILEKSLTTILDGVYENMLKYTREVRTPLTNVYMLGIILPTLALALLPLASALLQGNIKWFHVFLLFNIIVPFFVFYLVSEALLKRPGGYGESSALELNPKYQDYNSKKHAIKAFLIAFPLIIIGLLPFIFQIPFFTENLNLKSDYTLESLHIPFFSDIKLFGFECVGGTGEDCSGGTKVGPFSPFGVVFSLFIPLSIMLFFTIMYKSKTKEIIKAREDAKKLEHEFTNSLFVLGNRLGDGTPAEVAFGRVAEATQGQITQNFFSLVNQNIQAAGMSLETAIFDKKRGAIIYYPSALIGTSMRILVESVKKGLQVAARSLMSISEYVKNIDKINQRLRDLLAEIISDMKSNMTFLAPLLAGIVVGLASMISVILSRLKLPEGVTTDVGSIPALSGIMKLFSIQEMIPPFYLQVIVGLYLIEIVFILTGALVTVDSGKDTLKEKNSLARYLRSGMLLYIITALFSTVALSILSFIALGSIG